MCCWNLTNLPDPPPTFSETESQFSSVSKPILPVRFLTSLRDNNVKWSGKVILSGLSWILSSSALLRVCCWSSINYLIFRPHWYSSVTLPSHRPLKCMVFILEASSLDHALRKLPAPSQKPGKDTCFTNSGLIWDLMLGTLTKQYSTTYITTCLIATSL